MTPQRSKTPRKATSQQDFTNPHIAQQFLALEQKLKNVEQENKTIRQRLKAKAAKRAEAESLKDV